MCLPSAFVWPGACALGVLALRRGFASANSVSLTAKSVGQSGKAAGHNIKHFLSSIILHFLMTPRPLCSAHDWGAITAVGAPGMVQAVESRPGREIPAQPRLQELSGASLQLPTTAPLRTDTLPFKIH